MSFFKDFKEDLSQAVNELMPATTTAAPEPEYVEPEDTGFNPDELADMLRNIEEVKTEPAPAPAPVFAEPAPAPVYEEPAPAPAPVFAEPAPAPVFAEPAPAPAPVFAEPAPAPVYEEPAPAPSAVEPIFAPETVVPEDQKVTAAPIFGEPTVISEPINTVKNIKAMEVGLIIRGMNVTGDIASEGSLDIQGSVTGNISIEGRLEVTGEIKGNSNAEEIFADGAKIVGDVKCNGAVKVGPSSVIRGNITATAAVIAGAVKGDIDVQGPVILDSTAIIMGNIKSKSIQINNGATIEGLCSQCYGDVSPMSFFGDDKPEKPASKATKASAK